MTVLTVLDLFDSGGKMLTAIRPPDAIIPMRNGTESFSADSPPRYIDDGEGPGPVPEDPDSGRDNNSGFEGMHVSEDGQTLWVMLQSAAVQEGVSIFFPPISFLSRLESKISHFIHTPPGSQGQIPQVHPAPTV